MLLNIERLHKAGVTVRAYRNNDLFELPKNTKIELFFEGATHPRDLRAVVDSHLPGLPLEAELVTDHTIRKIQDFQLINAINNTSGE